MSEKLYNVECDVCRAGCQASEIRSFRVNLSFAGLHPATAAVDVHICELCILPEDQPIPFTVTEKGRAESMRQVAKENGNA